MECKNAAGIRRRRARRGVTLIEVLIASLMVSVNLAGVISFWSFAFSLSAQADRLGVASSLGRHALEAVRQTGFTSTPEGTSTLYYDNQGGNQTTTQTAGQDYSVTTSVVSDATIAGSNPVQPALTALRTITVTVKLISSGQTLYQISTYMARAGI